MGLGIILGCIVFVILLIIGKDMFSDYPITLIPLILACVFTIGAGYSGSKILAKDKFSVDSMDIKDSYEVKLDLVEGSDYVSIYLNEDNISYYLYKVNDKVEKVKTDRCKIEKVDYNEKARLSVVKYEIADSFDSLLFTYDGWLDEYVFYIPEED